MTSLAIAASNERSSPRFRICLQRHHPATIRPTAVSSQSSSSCLRSGSHRIVAAAVSKLLAASRSSLASSLRLRFVRGRVANLVARLTGGEATRHA